MKKFFRGLLKVILKILLVVVLIALGAVLVMTVCNLRDFGVLPEGLAQAYDTVYGWVRAVLQWLFGLA